MSIPFVNIPGPRGKVANLKPQCEVDSRMSAHPTTLTETIDIDALLRVLAHEGVPECEKVVLRRYRKMLKDGNKATVKYQWAKKYAKAQTGRVYAAGAMGLQSFSRKVRHALAGSLYWDLDMVCAQPRLLQHLCRDKGWSCPVLDDYISRRAAVLEEGAAHYDVVPHDVKDLYNRVLYLGGEAGWRKERLRTDKQPWAPAMAFIQEMRTLSQLIVANYADERELCNKAADPKRAKGDIGHDSQSSTMSLVLQNMEHRCLMAAYEYLASQDRPMTTLIFDGGLIERQPGEATVPEPLCRGIEAAVTAATGIETRWVVKPMDCEGRLVLDDVAPVEDFGTGKIDDLHAATTFAKMMGPHIARDGPNMYVFNTRTGIWETEDNAVRGAILRNAAALVFEEEVMGPGGEFRKVTHNYGGDLMKMKRLEELLPSIVPDTKFVERKGDSAKFKMLFADGIYDFSTGRFTAGFDPNIVFFHGLDRPFPKRDEALIADVRNVLFQQAFMSDSDPANEMGQFYLNAWTYGIVGEYRHKKLYIAIGPGNSGKGLTTDTMKAAFPGFVTTFTPENLVYRPGDTKDEAAKLMWLMDKRLSRIMIGNEMLTGEDAAAGRSAKGTERMLDGALMNRLSGGGDTITMRAHYKMPTDITWRTQVVMLANDSMRIRAEKSAAAIRYKYIEYRKCYVENAGAVGRKLGPMELVADKSIKDRYKTDAAIHNALFWVLADNWLAIRDQEYWTPECVKSESATWLGTEGADLRKTLEEAFIITNDAKDMVPFSEIKRVLDMAGLTTGVSVIKLAKMLRQFNDFDAVLRRHNGVPTKMRPGFKARDEDDVGSMGSDPKPSFTTDGEEILHPSGY